MYNEHVQDSDGLLQGSWMTKQVQCLHEQQAAGVPFDHPAASYQMTQAS